jgi:hypothetical protein
MVILCLSSSKILDLAPLNLRFFPRNAQKFLGKLINREIVNKFLELVNNPSAMNDFDNTFQFERNFTKFLSFHYLKACASGESKLMLRFLLFVT